MLCSQGWKNTYEWMIAGWLTLHSLTPLLNAFGTSIATYCFPSLPARCCYRRLFLWTSSVCKEQTQQRPSQPFQLNAWTSLSRNCQMQPLGPFQKGLHTHQTVLGFADWYSTNVHHYIQFLRTSLSLLTYCTSGRHQKHWHEVRPCLDIDPRRCGSQKNSGYQASWVSFL